MTTRLLFRVPIAAAILLSIVSQQAFSETQIGVFTGADPGEGLDLQGTFIYAVNVGTVGAAGKAGDAEFTADDVPGVTVTAVNQIANWHAPEYGDSPGDDVLELVMQSIRWSPAPQKPQVALSGLIPGATYKMQLLFAEQCCAGRGFDIYVDGQLIADEFNPAGVQGGAGESTQGAVVTHDFIALQSSVTIVLDGTTVTTPEFNDHNPILNGFTLEQAAAPGDDDNDGLADAWERLHFTDLAQTGSGDADSDGLTNAEELAAGSNPTLSDTDDDGLSDGLEVKTHGTSPSLADTDRDGLSDADEVTVHQTDPKLADGDSDGLNDRQEVLETMTNPRAADSDGDGFGDFVEFFTRTDPNNKNHIPRGTVINRFTGGDAGEGLDLDGTFPFAFNVGTPGPAGTARDANFTFDEDVGIFVSAGHEIASWHAPEYGDSPNDDVLEMVMQSIRWSNAANPDQPSVNIELAGLTTGQRYKLQLLFAEQCCAGRAFDIFVEEKQVADEFNPAGVQGGPGNKNFGVVVTYEFTAKDDTGTIVLDGRSVTTPRFFDHNAILNGVTLEQLNLGADSDNDGLPDAWENAELGNLTQAGSGDPDNDGVPNSLEFELSIAPNDADTDDDGLNDGAEVNVHKTHPNLADSDGDGLRDGDEVGTHGTNPTTADTDEDGLGDHAEVIVHQSNPKVKDTDGDGVADGLEVDSGMDPLRADAATFTNLKAEMFFGGDVDEGLDLDGKFLYAVNVGTGGAAGKVRDADFTADNAPGVRMQAGAQIAAWHAADYGDTANDNNLEKVMASIRHTPPVRLTFSNLVASATYKLQLLFSEQCCSNRGFDVLADGRLIADEFNPSEVQGGAGNTTAGAVVSAEFVALRDKLVVVLDGRGVTTPEYTDRNPILNGATLETVKEGTAPIAVSITGVKVDASGVTITFGSIAGRRYAVEYRESLSAGSWETVANSVEASGPTTTFTDNNSSRRAKAHGFYRIRSL